MRCITLCALLLAVGCAPHRDETVWQLVVRDMNGQVVESVRGDNCRIEDNYTYLSRDGETILRVAQSGHLTAECRRLR